MYSSVCFTVNQIDPHKLRAARVSSIAKWRAAGVASPKLFTWLLALALTNESVSDVNCVRITYAGQDL